ncbi:hypothetical protein WNB94_08295 [Aquabacterium sp. A3]|uniref:hypothetical protein n=1 Tax=Aquabacterium sp. A3 TaxID=3132829 RepID=UPI0031199F3E
MSMQTALISTLDVQSNSDPTSFERFFSQAEREVLKDKFQKPRETVPLCQPGKSCENNLFLGFFFDGTRNNYALSEESGQFTHSNVARLYAWVRSGDPKTRLTRLTQQADWPTSALERNMLDEEV